jgi:hypothetical protein
MDVPHEELEGSGLPEFLRKHNIETSIFDDIFEGGFDETITDELLKPSELRIIRNLRHGIPTLEVQISNKYLAEKKIEPFFD